MGSSSKSSSATTNNTRDGRVAGDNGALGVSAEGDVTVHMVADEAFDLGADALAGMLQLAQGVVDAGDAASRSASSAMEMALYNTQQSARTEAAQLSDQLIKIGIPAAALAFAVSQIWKK